MNQRHKEAKRKEKLILSMSRWVGIRTVAVSLFVIGFVLMYVPQSAFAQGTNKLTITNAKTHLSASISHNSPSAPTKSSNISSHIDNAQGCTDPGVTADSNTSGGNIDGAGNSYSQSALQSSRTQSTFIEGDLQFNLSYALSTDCISNGQVLSVTDATTADKNLGFIGSATNGSVEGTAIITYDDGSTQPFQLGLSDWTLGGGKLTPAYNNKIVTAQLYRNTRAGKQNVKTYLFFTSVPLQTGKKVVSVTLPNLTGTTQLHIFAWSTTNNNTADLYNNVGSTNDAYTQPGNFDHSGNSYAFDGHWLPGEPMEYQTPYLAPDVVSGNMDNYEAAGQTIQLDAQGQAFSDLGFIGAASNGPSYGTAYVHYTDGSQQSFTLGFSDWTLNGGTQAPSFSNQPLGAFKYRNTPNGQQNISNWLFKTEIAVDANKIIESVTLPSSVNQGQLHIFSIAPVNSFDNIGSTPDNASSFGNIDGANHSYSEDALVKAHIPMSSLTGVVTAFSVNGSILNWSTSQGEDPNDNIAHGQTLSYSGSSLHATHITFLGAATNGASSGTGTIQYTDGTTATYSLGMTDWCASPAQFGNLVVATLPYRNTASGPQNIKNYVFYAEVPVDPSKALQSITLPNTTGGQMHIFNYGYRIGPYNNIGGDLDEATQDINNFDGANDGYSYDALSAAGLPQGSVTKNGVTFDWHPSQYGEADDYQANGQVIPVSPVANATTLAFLGASANGSSSGAATITYTDGSTQTFTLGFTDWCQTTASFNNLVVATAGYRHTATGNQTIKTSIYYTDVTLTAGKTIQSVTLPNNGNIHVFSIATK